MSGQRVIVQRGVSAALISAVTTLTAKIRAGTQSTAHIGPLISPASAKNAAALITDAHARGAEVLVGDLSHDGATLTPHVLLGVEPSYPLWEQESFGPVLIIKVVDTEEELVELANQTEYSLTSAVWTRDMDKGLKISRRINAGELLFIWFILL